MREDFDAMKAALRVLAALQRQVEPDTADVQQLKQYSPGFDDKPLDELARGIVLHALRNRAQQRGGR